MKESTFYNLTKHLVIYFKLSVDYQNVITLV